MRDVVDVRAGGGAQHFHLVVLAQTLRKLSQQTSERPAHLLHALELVGFGPAAARIFNPLLTWRGPGPSAWERPARAPPRALASERLRARAAGGKPFWR